MGSKKKPWESIGSCKKQRKNIASHSLQWIRHIQKKSAPHIWNIYYTQKGLAGQAFWGKYVQSSSLALCISHRLMTPENFACTLVCIIHSSKNCTKQNFANSGMSSLGYGIMAVSGTMAGQLFNFLICADVILMSSSNQ